MKTFAIIGANFGDEGKGLMTDYVAHRENADVIVRFNGGAQAGHTVVTPEGQRHVFHHLSSGTYLGLPTYLSKFFIVNPLLLKQEEMGAPGIASGLYVDPDALVTVPSDMLINQAFEKKGGHGSCGVGINETMQRSKTYPLTVWDLQGKLWPRIVDRILTDYVPARLKELGLDMKWDLGQRAHWYEVFYQHRDYFLSRAKVTKRLPGELVVFEGAQGLALDQNADGTPYVTHSNTGMKNVRELCHDWGLPVPRPLYVTRTYLTRHGKGPLEGELPMPDWVKDETNVPHEYQGTLRYAPLTYPNIASMMRRIDEDANGLYDLAVTCIDQNQTGLRFMENAGLPIKYVSGGPTRDHVAVYKRMPHEVNT